jgi:hypothetical protein
MPHEGFGAGLYIQRLSKKVSPEGVCFGSVLTTLLIGGCGRILRAWQEAFCRTVDGLVQVYYGVHSAAMYRARYEELGHQPPFETPPSEADYLAAQQKPSGQCQGVLKARSAARAVDDLLYGSNGSFWRWVTGGRGNPVSIDAHHKFSGLGKPLPRPVVICADSEALIGGFE